MHRMSVVCRQKKAVLIKAALPEPVFVRIDIFQNNFQKLLQKSGICALLRSASGLTASVSCRLAAAFCALSAALSGILAVSGSVLCFLAFRSLPTGKRRDLFCILAAAIAAGIKVFTPSLPTAGFRVTTPTYTWSQILLLVMVISMLSVW
mgnify:CR=1 FL=1